MVEEARHEAQRDIQGEIDGIRHDLLVKYGPHILAEGVDEKTLRRIVAGATRNLQRQLPRGSVIPFSPLVGQAETRSPESVFTDQLAIKFNQDCGGKEELSATMTDFYVALDPQRQKRVFVPNSTISLPEGYDTFMNSVDSHTKRQVSTLFGKLHNYGVKIAREPITVTILRTCGSSEDIMTKYNLNKQESEFLFTGFRPRPQITQTSS